MVPRLALCCMIFFFLRSAASFRAPRHRGALGAARLHAAGPRGRRPAAPLSMVAATQMDGAAIARGIREELRGVVDVARRDVGVTPGLAVVLVGDRKDSQTYVSMKQKACEECNITSLRSDFPADVSQEELERAIRAFNDDPKIHGILVQRPLPDPLDEQALLLTVDPSKDVDGLHPLNVAQLADMDTRGDGSSRHDRRGGGAGNAVDGNAGGAGAAAARLLGDLERTPFPVACTPQGCVELLERSGVALRGCSAVVIGRSNIVGVPVALLLQRYDATVTVAHSKTRREDLLRQLRSADVVIVAVGRAGFVRGEWLKPGATVVDVGINAVDDATAKRGYRLVGDCDYESCARVASAITPVPGGVGPMTIAMLLKNTVIAALKSVA